MARLGGDEFVVVLEDLKGAADAERVAAKLLAALQEPVSLGEGSAAMSASIGIALGEGAAEPRALVARADAALYEAKASGRNAARTAR